MRRLGQLHVIDMRLFRRYSEVHSRIGRTERHSDVQTDGTITAALGSPQHGDSD
jgi:hypothetical protein